MGREVLGVVSEDSDGDIALQICERQFSGLDAIKMC